LRAFKLESEDMIIGKTDSNIVDESVVEKTKKYDNLVSTRKDSVTYQLTIRFKDGEEKVFHILKFRYSWKMNYMPLPE
jgi:hypothetical protein